MKLLLFSDLHSDFRTASKLVAISKDVDVVVGAGDFCIGRRGLQKIIDELARIEKPSVLVPGNSESHEALIKACRSPAVSWSAIRHPKVSWIFHLMAGAWAAGR